jgi:hypothetical protein
VNIMVDTGTTPAIIDEALADSLGLERLPGWLMLLDGAKRSDGAWLPDIRVGPVQKTRVPAVLHDLSYLKRRYGVTVGIVAGFDVFGDTSFRLDYSKRTLTFGEFKEDGMAIPVAMQWPFAVVNVDVDRQNLRLLVDTGAAGLVLFRERLHKRLYDFRSLRPTSVENLGGQMNAFGATPLRHVDLTMKGAALHTNSVFLVADNAEITDYDGLLGVRPAGFRALSYNHETRTLYLRQ